MAPRPRRNTGRRPYHRSGEHIVAKALPFLVERITDPTIAEAALTPLERAVRSWREEILADLGGDVPAAKRAVLDAAVGSKVILDSLDAFVFELAGSGRGLVNRRSRYAFRIVNDRMRVADSLVKQLATLGLDRQERPPVDLGTYLARRQAPPTTPTHEQGEPHGPRDDGHPNAPLDPPDTNGT
jgi:hypothetical protein